MQHYNININLNDIKTGKVKGTIKQIERAITRGTTKGITQCERQIKLKLLERMDNYDLSGSQLSTTIRSIKGKDSLSIRMGSEYFMYVEYGTGIVGEENQHPDTKRVGWDYDSRGPHGESGWWYPSTADDPNPLKYTGKNGQIWAWTKGQKARPFMYETWLWALKNCNRIISDSIGREIRKLGRKS